MKKPHKLSHTRDLVMILGEETSKTGTTTILYPPQLTQGEPLTVGYFTQYLQQELTNLAETGATQVHILCSQEELEISTYSRRALLRMLEFWPMMGGAQNLKEVFLFFGHEATFWAYKNELYLREEDFQDNGTQLHCTTSEALPHLLLPKHPEPPTTARARRIFPMAVTV